MTPNIISVLVALALLQVKHLVADFLLQTPSMIREKGRYGRPLGLLHSVIHIIGSAPVLLWLTSGEWTGTVGLVLAAEFVIHYHIDWFKETLNRRLGMAPSQARFWYVTGADQMLHQLTYIGMVGWVVASSGSIT